MTFKSTPELRTEIVTACKVLTRFRIVEGFGHVSARVPGSDRVVITPRRALGLVTEGELVELDMDGRQVAGEIGRPPLEAIMHVAVYKRRPEVMGIARGHPRAVAAYACSGASLEVAHGFGANLGPVVRCTKGNCSPPAVSWLGGVGAAAGFWFKRGHAARAPRFASQG
jgi:ribulose-5-phosphate 4-epimerase/fuculose-1-phosphate aldolase